MGDVQNIPSHTIIIAEIGVNHNGDLETAKKMVQIAADAGADFVKFQTFSANSLVVENAKMAEYQIANTGSKQSQKELLRALELPREWHPILIKLADDLGIQFLTTAFDLENLRFIESLKPEVYKIPSGEITNLPYLKLMGSFGKKVIMSTGMASLDEI
ncbi:MAG: N-acetylneuraminate synthase family protein, partial [Alphaproteobacteria bacterium]|nr:N-acetylneuraminate synthase family protein [Alphaproteobacteria bacterium]